MTEQDIYVNNLIMSEMGLEMGPRKRVYDAESGVMQTMRGKELVAPGFIPSHSALLFDPINNARMMNHLFGTYVQTLSDEGTIDDVVSWGVMPSGVPGKIKAEINLAPEGQPIRKIQSKPYNNETTCLMDLVMRINGEEPTDLEQYDYDRRKVIPMSNPKSKKKGK